MSSLRSSNIDLLSALLESLLLLESTVLLHLQVSTQVSTAFYIESFEVYFFFSTLGLFHPALTLIVKANLDENRNM